MNRTELEEGEACPFPDDDENIDPDIAFSYIDEWIQDVLGHYQKDFEAGAYAESLGARFGGYGSFLPVHWRSTSMLAKPETPNEVGNCNIPRAVRNRSFEGSHKDSMVLHGETLHVRHGPDSDMPLPPSIPRISMDSDCKDSVGTQSNPCNQNKLKFRIKIGSRSILSQKNSEIYSGLGLDMSSSLEENPVSREGNFVESQETLGESPSSIIKIMTSFPVPDCLLLSPLEDSLVHFFEGQSFQDNGRFGSVQESSTISANKLASEGGIGEVCSKKKIKLRDKNRNSVEEHCNGAASGVGTYPKQETQNSINMENNSSAMKLLITSKEKVKDRNAAEDTGRTSDDKTDVTTYKIGATNLGKGGALDSISNEHDGQTRKGNGKTGLVEKVHKDIRADLNVRLDSRTKVESSYDPSKVDQDLPKTLKSLAGRAMEPASEIFDQKAPSCCHSGTDNTHGKEEPFSEGKKQLKATHCHGRSAAKSPKESLRIGRSTAAKDKNACRNYFPAKVEGNDMKSHKDLKQDRDSHTDFVGKMKWGNKRDRRHLIETPLEDKVKFSKIVEVEEEINEFNVKLMERSGGKKTGSQSTFDVPMKGVLEGTTSLTENAPNSNVFSTGAAPILIEENWVLCDRCHKWRLLPYGTNTNHLPKKWICSMLNWLPGMNKCSFSEEETTNALNAQYQVPIPDVQTNQRNYSGGIALDVTLDSAQHLDQISQDVGFNAALHAGKKKGRSTAVRDAGDAKPLKIKSKREADQDGFRVHKKAKEGSIHYTDVVQNPAGSVKQIASNDQKNKELSSPRYSQNVAKDVLLASREKQKNLAEKMVVREEHIKREIHGKKKKLKNFQETQIHTGSPMRKPKQLKIDDEKDNKHSSRYSQDLARDGLLASAEKKTKRVEKIVALEENGRRDISSKRKLTDCQDSQMYLETPLKDHPKARKAEELSYQKNAFCDRKEMNGEDRKDKATRILSNNRNCPVDDNMQYKEDSIGNDCPQVQYHGSELSQLTLDGKSCLINDLESGKPSVATALSSSKVSAMRKIKVDFQKHEGFSVESVSSSPLRISNPLKLSKSLLQMDDATNAGIALVNGQGRSSEGKCDSGSCRFEMVRKNKSINLRSQESTKFNSPTEMDDKNQSHDKERLQNQYHFPNSSPSQKPGKRSSSRTKEHLVSNSSARNGRIKNSDSFNEQKDLHPTESLKYVAENETQDCEPCYKGEMNSVNIKTPGNYNSKPEKAVKDHIARKAPAGKHPSDCSGRSYQLNLEQNEVPHAQTDTKWQDVKSTAKKNLLQNHDTEIPMVCHASNRDDIASGVGKSTYFSPCRDKESMSPCSVTVSEKVSRHDLYGGAQAPKLLGKAGMHNEFHQVSFRHFAPNVRGPNDIDARNPLKMNLFGHAANNALKEARNLKHSANHLKTSGSGLESTMLFFQAALKFLHGASLLEPCNSDPNKYGEMASTEVYGTTAKLCEYCGHEYERCKDLASAALAYKCMEVSYMRVIYSNDFIASSDRQELQLALQMVPSADSPSSSASDVDNANYQAIVDKTDVAKNVDLPRFAGNHVIAARNQPHFVRLLDFVQEVNIAMEASKKSQDAFAAASVVLAERGNNEGISLLKKVLDFNFHDVEGLLRLVCHAMEVLND